MGFSFADFFRGALCRSLQEEGFMRFFPVVRCAVVQDAPPLVPDPLRRPPARVLRGQPFNDREYAAGNI